MNKIIDFVKSKKGIIIISCVIFVILVTILAIILSRPKVTKLEKIKIEEYSDKYFDYIDYILLYPENDDRYLNFALTYLSETSDKKEYTSDEVIDLINEVFAIDYNQDNIDKVAAMEGKVKSGFDYDIKKKIFKYVGSVSRSDIAKTTISTYEIDNIKKKSKNKFEVTYYRYTIENPYLIYDYYNELNVNEEEKVDLNDLTEYLKGNRKVSDIKKYINKSNIEKFGKIEKNVKITFVLKNNKLTIKEKK